MLVYEYDYDIIDWCLDPFQKVTSLDLGVTGVGSAPGGLLHKGEGDCDTDSDCWAHLKCMQRENALTLIPGIEIPDTQRID